MASRSAIRLALTVAVLGLVSLASISWGQSRGVDHTADAASLRAGTSFSLSAVLGTHLGDTLTTKFDFDSHGDSIMSLRMCVKFDTNKIQFVAFDKSTYYDWIGKADSVLMHGGNSVGYMAVEGYNIHDVVINDCVFAFTWAVKCLSDGERVPLDWFYLGPYDNDFRITNTPGTFEPESLNSGFVGVLTSIGDANENGLINSADIIYLVNFLFKTGPAPLPCTTAGDLDCSGDISSADVIHLVNYTFKGSGKPCDICSAAAIGWPCK